MYSNLDAIQTQKYAGNCPSGSYYGFHSYFGRGKHDIVRALTCDPPELGFNERLRHIIWSCTLCGNCQIQCNPLKALESTNATMALREYGLSHGWKMLDSHHGLVQSVLNYDNPWMAPRARRKRWAKKLDFEVKDATREKVEVLFFPGCNEAYVEDMIPVSTVTARILKLAGVDFGILGEKERCCGSTAFRVGAVEMFNKYKARSIEQLNSLGIRTMVTACAGCHSTFKHNYAGELDFEVLHIVEFLDRMISEGKIEFTRSLDRRVTYHDPCHIGRYGKIYDEPRRVLEALPGVELREMERIRENSWCCGSGGGVKTAYPELALWAAQERLKEARDVAGADTVVSTCPFCELNLGDAAKSASGGMEVVDLMQLVGEALGY